MADDRIEFKHLQAIYTALEIAKAELTQGGFIECTEGWEMFEWFKLTVDNPTEWCYVSVEFIDKKAFIFVDFRTKDTHIAEDRGFDITAEIMQSKYPDINYKSISNQ